MRLAPHRFDFARNGSMLRAATVVVEHQGRRWFLQFAASDRLASLLHLEFALPFMGIGITLFAAILLVVFTACAWVMLRRMLRPLRELSASAAAITPRSLHARLPSGNVPSEIVPLVDSFNRVLERVEQGYRLQQDFLATAAHELKTPLALTRAQLEFLPAGEDRDALLKDIEHMTRQVQQLLILAEASETRNYALAPTDVLEVAREAADYLQRMAQGLDVRLALPLADAGPVLWPADRGALFTLLKNLMENALQHAPAGSVVSVTADPDELSVRDHGPGVDAAQLPRLFTRFWRGAHRRDHGAGLGLTICQEIAQAHGWALSASNETPGLRMTLSRPTTAPE